MEFICDECGKAFSRRSSLTRHLRGGHGTGLLECDSCSLVYTRRDSLLRHQRMKHARLVLDDSNKPTVAQTSFIGTVDLTDDASTVDTASDSCVKELISEWSSDLMQDEVCDGQATENDRQDEACLATEDADYCFTDDEINHLSNLMENASSAMALVEVESSHAGRHAASCDSTDGVDLTDTFDRATMSFSDSELSVIPRTLLLDFESRHAGVEGWTDIARDLLEANRGSPTTSQAIQPMTTPTMPSSPPSSLDVGDTLEALFRHMPPADPASTFMTSLDFQSALRHPAEAAALYQCDACPLAFVGEEQWLRHKARHQESQPFICGLCFKSFRRSQLLFLHERHCGSETNARKRPAPRDRVYPSGKRMPGPSDSLQPGPSSHASVSNDQPVGKRMPSDDPPQQHGHMSYDADDDGDGNDDGDRGGNSRVDQAGGMAATSPALAHTEASSSPYMQETSLDNTAVTYRMDFDQHHRGDLLQRLRRVLGQFTPAIVDECQNRTGIKFFISLTMVFEKANDPDTVTDPPVVFRSEVFRLMREDNHLSLLLDAGYDQLLQTMEQFERNGSSWIVSHFSFVDIGIITFDPTRASSYLPLPRELETKRALINVRNDDQKCFLWAILSAMHPVNRTQHANRLANYQRYENSMNVDGLTFPMPVKDIGKFEALNNVTVDVFGYEDSKVFPLRISVNRARADHVNLLLISDDGTDDNAQTQTHYVWIKSMSRLLGSQMSRHGHAMYFCHYCMHACQTQHILDRHMDRCKRHGAQRVKLPQKNDSNGADKLSFTRIEAQHRLPFAIYADTEALLLKHSTCANNPEQSSTVVKEYHEACGFGYVVRCTDPRHSQPVKIFRGPDTMERFLDDLTSEAEKIRSILRAKIPMVPLTPEEKLQHDVATECYICGQEGFSTTAGNSNEQERGHVKVRDHDHLTGSYRGAAHSNCNLQYRINPEKVKIPVLCHNLRGYDAHHILSAVKPRHGKVTCIPNNTEKYVMFTVGSLTFMDSLQFMASSLGSLVSDLAASQLCATRDYLEQTIPAADIDARLQLMTRKGVYPYEYMDDWDKFEEAALPPRESFYSTLTEEHITEEEYAHAQNVFTTMGMQSLGDYHDFYLTTDVLLLADVFETFRDSCLRHYGLDPCHFFTSPGLAWQAALKMTGVRLDLLTDIEEHLFIESGLRGGVATITHRYATANAPGLPGYDPASPKEHLMYLDANNLYGWSMSQLLPTGDFQWLSETEIDNLDVMALDDDGTRGYILEVDLAYKASLHNHHSDYPLAPERMTVTQDMLSPTQLGMLATQERISMMRRGTDFTGPIKPRQTGPACPKLVPNLQDKERYVVHYRNLKFYLQAGLELKRVHRVMSFEQSAWLKPYIDFNTTQRTAAQSEFDKGFFKLMNNSVFGKTMENLRNRKNVDLATTPKQLKKLAAKPTFKSFKIFHEHLTAVERAKAELYLCRPIYVGFCVLDLSKLLMYDFHYNYIKTRYPDDASKLLFTDTDSLAYVIRTDDIYADMKEDAHLFDFSGYDIGHPCYSSSNKKVLGKFKDELHGIPMEGFVGLRAKMYSFHYLGKEVKKAKGVRKVTVQKSLSFEDYKTCLFNSVTIMRSMSQIRSYNHQLYTVVMTKAALSSFDDKRYLLDDCISTIPHGHWSIAK